MGVEVQVQVQVIEDRLAAVQCLGPGRASASGSRSNKHNLYCYVTFFANSVMNATVKVQLVVDLVEAIYILYNGLM